MIRLLILMAICLPIPALAAPLVADMSIERIDMDANFSGTRVFLFGARSGGGDVVAIVRGPTRDYQLRKKERFAGVWINSSRMKFFHMPAFYMLAASKPLPEIGKNALLRTLGIGEENLFSAPADPETQAYYTTYAQALLDYQHASKHYAKIPGSVEFVGGTLFKTALDFPSNIPPGNYDVELYLIDKNQVTAKQVLPLVVSKTGMDAWLYNYAHAWPTFYGLTAVVLALSAGWFAGRLFEKL
jgi:uncharacterized protein (TIGR02186 family)